MRQRIHWEQTWRFCLAAFCMDLASGMYLVALPYLAMSIGAGSMGLGVLAALSGGAYVLACLVSSPLSDRHSRRGLIVAAAVGLTFVYLATARTAVLWQLCLLALGWGLSLSLFWPPVFGWLGDSLRRDELEAATGAVNVSWALGALLGGVLGGWLYAVRVPLAFLAPIIPVLAACAAMVFSPCPHGTPAPLRTAPRTPGARRALAAVWLGNLSVCSLLGLMGGVFPKLGEQIGVDARAFGLLMAGLALGRLPAFVLALRWGRWLHDWRVGMVTQLLAAVMVATVSQASAYAWLSLVFLSVGLTGGANYYRGLFKSLEGEGSRGFKSGMHEASLMAGYLVGSLASGALAGRWGLRAPYVPISLLTVGLVAAQVILVRSASRAQAAGHAEAAP